MTSHKLLFHLASERDIFGGGGANALSEEPAPPSVPSLPPSPAHPWDSQDVPQLHHLLLGHLALLLELPVQVQQVILPIQAPQAHRTLRPASTEEVSFLSETGRTSRGILSQRPLAGGFSPRSTSALLNGSTGHFSYSSILATYLALRVTLVCLLRKGRGNDGTGNQEGRGRNRAREGWEAQSCPKGRGGDDKRRSATKGVRLTCNLGSAPGSRAWRPPEPPGKHFGHPLRSAGGSLEGTRTKVGRSWVGS